MSALQWFAILYYSLILSLLILTGKLGWIFFLAVPVAGFLVASMDGVITFLAGIPDRIRPTANSMPDHIKRYRDYRPTDPTDDNINYPM